MVPQAEELEPAQARRAQEGFDLLLVSECLEPARGHGEVALEPLQSVAHERLAEDLEVAGSEYPRITLAGVEVRIRRVTARLVDDERAGRLLDCTCVVTSVPARDPAHSLTPDLRDHVEVAAGSASCRRVES